MPEATCGLYLITDPERQIEIEMLHMDISCEDGGLISVGFLILRHHKAFGKILIINGTIYHYSRCNSFL